MKEKKHRHTWEYEDTCGNCGAAERMCKNCKLWQLVDEKGKVLEETM